MRRSTRSIYREALLFLVTAGVVAPLFFRIHVSPVLGYLLAGVALGPFGLGRLAGRVPWLDAFALTNVEAIDRLAAFGVVALMFTIGLELKFERLKSLRKLVFGLGLAQVARLDRADRRPRRCCSGRRPPAALIFGAALSLSSTAIVVPVLAEHKLMTTAVGRLQFRGPAVSGPRGRAAAVHGRDAGAAQRRGRRARPRPDRRACRAGGRPRHRPRAAGAAAPVSFRRDDEERRNSSWRRACSSCSAPR